MSSLGVISPEGLQPGFADPVRDAQHAFRAVLAALAHPGRLCPLGDGLEPPPPLAPAMAALCLTLVDRETPLWLDPAAANEAVRSYLRFHCAAALVGNPREARFAVITDASVTPPIDKFDLGTDELPERSTTLLLQVRSLSVGPGWRLSGPGIADQTQLLVDGLPETFTAEWARNHELFPRGIDVILVAGHAIAALPRTTRIRE